jgi:hypothetical protein
MLKIVSTYSNIFLSIGAVKPSLTIMAKAMRAVDHLNNILK